MPRPDRRRREALALAVLAACVLLAAGAARADECLPERELVNGELLIVLRESDGNPLRPQRPLDDVLADFARSPDKLAGYHLEPVHPARLDLDWIPVLLMARRVVVVDPGGPSVAAAVENAEDALRRLDGVRDAEAHEEVDTPEGGGRTLSDLSISRTFDDVVTQPAATLTRVPEARALATGAGVVVAIVDGGASLVNPDLAGSLAGPGLDLVDGASDAGVPPNGLDDDGDTLIDEGAWHATHVAGIIHAVAPQARLLHVRVLDDDSRGEAFDVAHGVVAAVQAGARVINLSLGLPHESRALEKALEHAIEAGVTVVSAAGNRGQEPFQPCVDYPASVREAEDEEHPALDVIAVAAVDDAFAKAPFSSWGPEVDLSAPGVRVLSTFGDDQWSHWDGTSFATPLVAGGAALILGRYPTLTPAQVQQVLVSTVQPDAILPEHVGFMGAGVLDLAAAAAVALPVRETLMLTEQEDGTRCSFTEVLGATRHDVLRGDLASLRDAGVVVDLGALTCVADDVTPAEASAIRDAGRPGAGNAFFYLVRDDAGPDDLGRDSRGRARAASSVDCAP